jgi:hypothetical protein
MEYVRTPLPGLNPLVFILVDSIDVRERGQGGHGRLFGGLAGEKASRVLGKDDTNGEVRVVYKSGYDEWELYDRNGTASSEKKVRFAIVERRGEGCGRGALGFIVVVVGIIGHGSQLLAGT